MGGTPAALLDALKKAATDVEGTARRSAGWPTSPRALSAQLTRLEPSLKRVHKITVTHGRGGVRGRSRLVTLQGEPPEEAADFASAFASVPSTAPDLHEHPPADGADGADAKSGTQSGEEVGARGAAKAGAEAGHSKSPRVWLSKRRKLTFDEMCEMIDKAGSGLSKVDNGGQPPLSDYDRYLADDEDEP